MLVLVIIKKLANASLTAELSIFEVPEINSSLWEEERGGCLVFGRPLSLCLARAILGAMFAACLDFCSADTEPVQLYKGRR